MVRPISFKLLKLKRVCVRTAADTATGTTDGDSGRLASDWSAPFRHITAEAAPDCCDDPTWAEGHMTRAAKILLPV